ncbi:MAG: TlpA disulfide reductase family protein [Ignavibacteriaceae bacterium]|jgi:peroxiredoxin|nr:TlpA family protein disulfide reductase [Ignavibacterium sp.]MDX9711725.1 TlpA disulfide reductase family protein [Ignavibacteriaceae bacterium]MEB2354919.1 TlpA disulfide reductase family protein [Ignavibacteriales bacterium]GIK23478.1 MAG: thiol-disulfide oxidoreductase ResA [Ignavibacteriota bacterium]
MRSLLVLLSITLFSVLIFAQGEEDLKGRKAPNFKLTDLNGKYVELNKETGSGPVLISFWATWCKPCLEEMAEFNKIYSQYKDKGFKLLAISTDTEKTVAKVKPYIKSKGYDFTVLFDTNSDAARKYYAQQMPYTVMLDKNGNIVYSHLGYMKGDEIKVEKLLLELLEK